MNSIRLHVRRYRRQTASWLYASPRLLALEAWFDRRYIHAILSAESVAVEGQHLLVATAGSGNIGDQAMFEAYLANTVGHVTVVLQSEGGLTVPDRHETRVSVLVLPTLFQGSPLRRMRERRALVSELRKCRYFSVVGADIMDGGYGRREAALRFGLLRAAGEAGLRTTLLGFSWSDAPDEYVRRCARQVGDSVRLCVRDPRSLARLSGDGVSPVTLVADTVFALEVDEYAGEAEDWLRAQSGRGRQTVIINVSGLVSRYVDLLPEYRHTISHLLSRGASVLLLPHVIREGDDDLIPCALLHSEHEGDLRVHLVREQLSPGQVSRLASIAAGVFTARMHLSILALGRGTPVAVVSTQGKVEGLMEMFEASDCVLDMNDGLGGRAIQILEKFLASDEPRARVISRLDEVIKKAAQNFAPC